MEITISEKGYKPFQTLAHRGKARNPLNRKKNMFGGDKSEKELQEEFAPYYNSFSFFYDLGALAAYVKASFNDGPILAGYNGGGGFGIGLKSPDEHYIASFQNFAKEFVSPTPYMNIHGNTVTNVLSPVVVSSHIYFEDDNAVERIQEKFDALFGKGAIDLSKVFHVKENTVNDLDTPKLETEYKSLSAFKSVKIPNESSSSTYAPEKFDYPYRLAPALDKVVLASVKLMGIRVGSRGRNALSGVSNAAPLKGCYTTLTFQVDAKVVYPLKFALWLTYASSLSEFIPKLFKDRICELASSSILEGRRGRKAMVGALRNKYARVMHLGKVKEINEGRYEEFGNPKPRVNKDGFSILREGQIIYVPEVDNTSKYVEMLREAYNPDTGVTIPTNKIEGLKNMPLYTDWLNDAFGYTNAEGKANSILLQGAIPLDDATIGVNLRKYNLKSLLENKEFVNLGEEVCQTQGIAEKYSSEFARINPLATTFSGLCAYLNSLYWEDSLQDFFSKSEEGNADADLVKIFMDYCEQISKNVLNYKKRAISRLIFYKYFYHLCGVYAREWPKYNAIVNERKLKNAPLPRSAAKTSFTLPNMPGIKNVLPHQAPILTQAEKGNEFNVYEAGAGAGKTFMFSATMLIQIAEGRAKRAAVVCPNKLVKEYCTELNNYSKGKVNALPLTMDTIKETFIKHMGFDKKKFVAYLKKAPKNTIFIISYGLIQTKSDYFTGEVTPFLQFGEELINFYPMAQIFRQIGIDIIAIDESHFLKNEDSNRAKAIKFITPNVGRITIGSGTLEKDNPADAPSQYGLINPAIYGSKQDFIKNYGQGDGGEKFIDWKSQSAMVACKQATLPYTYNARTTKIDWSQLLPRITLQMIPIFMTPNQQLFYDSILRDALKELESNQDLVKLLKEGDDEDKANKKIESALKRGLNNVEQFIYAPDQNVAFRSYLEDNGIRPTRADFISTSLLKVDELISMRLEGLRYVDGKKVPDPAGPSKNKIIVAYINKSASRHAFTHSKYRDIAVHYASDSSSLLENQDGKVVKSAKTGADMLDKFRADDKVKILFADITSIREGFNLQVADTFIRAQTPWSPGETEQEQARVLRPDVYNKYGRENVYLYWLQIRHSHVIAKTARLISKMVAIHQKNESLNPSWKNFKNKSAWPESLEHISMNMDFLHNILNISGAVSGAKPNPNDPAFIARRESDIDMEYLSPQFNAYGIMSDWEEEEFDNNIKLLAKETAERTGKPVSEIDPFATTDPEERKRRLLDLRLSSMLKNDGNAVTIDGSKTYFVPIQPGAMPVDPYNVNLIPIARAKPKVKAGKESDSDYDELDVEDDDEDEGDDDSAGMEDNISYEVGDIVYTEFGIGEIEQLRNTGSKEAKTIKIKIPGLANTGIMDKDELWLKKNRIFIPKEPTPALDSTGKPTPQAVEENAEWKKNFINLTKSYKRARDRGTGILFVTNGVPTDVPKVIEDKTPVIKPKPIEKPDIQVDLHNDNDDNVSIVRPKVDRDKLKDLIKLNQDRANKAKDSIPSKPKPAPKDNLSVDVDVINGMVALQFYSEDEEFKRLRKEDSMVRVLPPYMDIHIKTTKGAQAFIDLMDEMFILPQTHKGKDGTVLGTKDKFLAVVKRMGNNVKKNSTLSVYSNGGSHLPIAKGIANFYKIAHTPPVNNTGARPGIKMYTTVWNDELFMCIPINNQKRQAKMFIKYFNEHKHDLGYPNQIGKPSIVQGTAVKLFGDVHAAIAYLQGLANNFNVSNYAETLSKLKGKTIKKMISAPSL